MKKTLINSGIIEDSSFINDNGADKFVIEWLFKESYYGTKKSWMVGSGCSAKGGSYEVFQDVNNNGKYDSNDKKYFVATGSISKGKYKQSKNLDLNYGAGYCEGFSDMTADFYIGSKKISTAKWW